MSQWNEQGKDCILKKTNLASRFDKILRENLSLKTREFVKSLQEFWKEHNFLTERQSESFQKIESAWSPEQKKLFEAWTKQYREEYLSDAKVMAAYYIKTGYYTKISYNIISEDYTPNRKDFLRMYNNSYAQKVLIATRSEPMFAVNDLVQVRATVGKTWSEKHMKKFKLRKCFVLKNDLPVINAVKGAKRYEVLPMGSSEPIKIDERYLMKPNKRGKNS